MTTQITLELPDHLYTRAQELAAQQKQDVARVITTLLGEALTAEEQLVDLTEPDPAAQREMEAYLDLYPALVTHYLGEYVAIFQGELVDHDVDFGTIMSRVESQYPDDFVLVTRVDTVPIRTINIRSPRLSYRPS